MAPGNNQWCPLKGGSPITSSNPVLNHKLQINATVIFKYITNWWIREASDPRKPMNMERGQWTFAPGWRCTYNRNKLATFTPYITVCVHPAYRVRSQITSGYACDLLSCWCFLYNYLHPHSSLLFALNCKHPIIWNHNHSSNLIYR